MRLIWCTRKGIRHGFQNELIACVACTCRQRKTCKTYAEVPLEEVAIANRDAKQAGYQSAEDLPLFEAAIKANNEL